MKASGLPPQMAGRILCTAVAKRSLAEVGRMGRMGGNKVEGVEWNKGRGVLEVGGNGTCTRCYPSHEPVNMPPCAS